MHINGRTELYGIIGKPVRHTASPAMHNAAFRQLGMNAAYVPMEVDPGQLGSAVAGLRALGFIGFNVTVPHKTGIIPHLDSLADTAAELGAVNTVEVRDGALIGHNTDSAGFMKSLESENIEVRGTTACVVGAGGAARAVLHALREAGARRVFVLNRTLSKAEEAAKAFTSESTGIEAVDISAPGHFSIVGECNIIINATSLGLRPEDALPLEVSSIRPGQTVVDIIYRPWKTRLLEQAETAGARTVNGYGMLAYQAAAAFEIWTGRPAPIEAMWKSGKEEPQ